MSDDKKITSLPAYRRHKKKLGELTLVDAIDMITKLHTAVTDLVAIVEKHEATIEVLSRYILQNKKSIERLEGE